MSPILAERYDAVLVDLDGVMYRGDEPVAGSGAVVDKVRALGVPVLFLTNNSSRTPEAVAAKLETMEVSARPEEILTAAVATAVMLEEEGASGQTAFVVGEEGITTALAKAGISVARGEPQNVDLVVVGIDRSANYAKLRTASLLVERGARLIATNGDGSYPAPDGLWPGAGALLAAIVATTGAAPLVVGKPSRPLFEAAQQVTGARAPLVVGDRLDTDVAGAAGMGWDSLLVWTGASEPSELIRAAQLPTYVGSDISVLLHDVLPARFRAASEGDVQRIAGLLAASGLNAAGTDQRLSSTLVSVDDDRVTATACVEDFRTTGLLRSVAVRRDLRGQGLGLLVVAAALQEARRRGIHEVALFTESAAPFFERMGFRRVERTDLPASVHESAQATGECPASAAAMRLEL
ncbi:MAG: HAD-IIA family hydrolase [Actinomycetota bacterium]|nr:HAD-IIA family hydrolase [Actinomycetota bacterium]